MKYTHAKILDEALMCFEHTPVRIEDFYAAKLPYDDEVIAFLTTEGFLKQDTYSIQITYKGRIRLDEGGFVGLRRRKIVTTIISIVTVLAAITTVVLQIVL